MKTYEGRVRFTITPAYEGNKPVAGMEEFGFGKLKHGMVGLSPDGEVLFTIAGHNYARDEIAKKVEEMLR